VDASGIRRSKIRGGSVIKGTIEFLKDLSNDVEMESIVYKFQGNEFRLTPFKMARSKLCDYLKQDVYMIHQFRKAFSIPEDCPLKKGIYSGEFQLKPTLPPNFDGKYKIVSNLYYLGKPSDNYYFIFEIHNYPM
jgi:hypothetical protein